jgi:hypothetical protein
MHELLLQAFPFPSPLGEVKLHPLSQAGVFNYSSHGKWALSTLLWSLPPTTTFISFPAPDCWACAATPAFSSRLIYLQFWEGFPSPLLRCSGLPTLFAMCLFCVVVAYYSVFLFSLGGGSVCPGGYADLSQGCLWGYHVPLSSPCGLCLPKPSGCWHLAATREPCCFLSLT